MAKTVEADKSVVVTEVKVRVAGKDLALKIEDAKKLYEVLGELFANPTVVTQKEYVFWNYPPINAPIIPWHNPTWIVCGQNSNLTYGTTTVISAEVK